MAQVVGGRTPEHSPSHQMRWSVHPWRLIPPLLVLLTVVAIWLTRWDPLLANHWAYPVAITAVGLVALYLVIDARPRRLPPPLAYPDPVVPD